MEPDLEARFEFFDEAGLAEALFGLGASAKGGEVGAREWTVEAVLPFDG